jgi:hypothetical protein
VQALASAVITAASIASDAITAAKIATDAITSAKIADGTITATKIASDAITAAKIAADAITSTQIADGALSAAKIAADACEKIADALLNRAVEAGSNTGRLVKEALYFLRNRWTNSGGTLTVYEPDDTTTAWTAATSTAAGNPVTEVNPA